jgi:uncharacterized protein
MDPIRIIRKYYAADSPAYNLLMHHSMMVAEKALRIAQHIKELRPDREFIRQASILHDIGIFLTNEPGIGCHGEKPYICHGYLGREILEKEGYPLHALVCERHVGVGLAQQDIEQHNLPVPSRDMIPVSVEEQIICFADKFFSKTSTFLLQEKPLESIRKDILKFGEEKLSRFDAWLKLFGNP